MGPSVGRRPHSEAPLGGPTRRPHSEAPLGGPTRRPHSEAPLVFLILARRASLGMKMALPVGRLKVTTIVVVEEIYIYYYNNDSGHHRVTAGLAR